MSRIFSAPNSPKPPLQKVPDLCVTCQGLRLDDEGSGGFREESDEGVPILRFKKERTMIRRQGILKPLMVQQRTDSLPGFPTLAKSAAAGCGFCDFLHAAFLRAKIPALEEGQGEVSVRLAYAWGVRDGQESDEGLQALVAEVLDARGQRVGVLHFGVYASTARTDDATADWLGLYDPPRAETLCPENITFLKDSLDSCTGSCHPVTTGETPFLPTRLLDLGLGTAAADHPRLIITADSFSPAEPVRYAAVSYCWGDEADASAQPKTDPSNLHERLRAIPLCDMSAVMQDSIAVCRALSVRYLWIDALCIIQDPTDASDWERESERVGQVYHHAYFTICAVSMPSCHQSFLARPQHTFAFPFQSALHPPARGTYTLHFMGEYDGIPDHTPLHNDLRSSPWLDRGWVFQENELSVRKLLFGRHMVHFECTRHERSENGEAFPRVVNVDWYDLDRSQAYDYFRESSEAYAARRLSYESDRLPALAGLAKQVADSVGGTYLAGLWLEDLHVGLLWNSVWRKQTLAERLDSLRRLTGEGAPSWSWASQPGEMEYDLLCFRRFWANSRVRREYSDLVAWTSLKGVARLNPFGEVKSGTVRIRGKVLPVPADFVLRRHPEGRRHNIRQGSSSRSAIVAYCYPDWTDTAPKLPGGVKLLLLSSWCSPEEDVEDEEDEDWEDESSGDEGNESDSGDEGDAGQRGSPKVAMDSPDTVPSEDGSRCPCNNSTHTQHAAGLILHPTGKAGEYYRVGIFGSRHRGRTGGTRLFDDLEDTSICLV